MAAYEAFAVGNIPGKVGTTTMRGEFRGGGISINEIPNMPQVDPSMPVAGYPDVKIPARYEYQKYLTGFEDRAKALKQEELPGGFARAAAKTAAVAGSGESAMAENVVRGTSAIAGALDSLSEVISKVQRESSNSKDSTDEQIRYKNLEDVYDGKFKSDMIKENVPVQEWPERWKNDYNPQFQKDAAALGVYPVTKDRIQARAVGFNDRMTWSTTLEGAKKQRQDDNDVTTASFNDSIEHQNWQGASEANDNLLQHDYISKADHQANKWKIENAMNKQVLATQITTDPDHMLDEIDRIENPKEGKPPTSPEFQWLKNDAVSRKQAKEEAQQEKNKRETESERKFVDGVASGEIKPENIDEEGQKAKLRPSFIKAVKKDAKEEDPAYNPRVATRLNTDIDSYNWHDYPNEKDTLARYHELKEQIFELPKADRQDYNQRLDKRLDDLRENKKQTLDEERITSAKKYIDTLDDSKAFGEDGTKLVGEKRVLDVNDPKAVIQNREHYAKIEAMKNDVEQWIKANPKANLYDLQEHVGKLVNKYGVGAVQNLKPFTAEEYKDAGSPTRKGPTVQERADAERERAKLGRLAPSGVTVGATYTVPVSAQQSSHLGGVFTGKIDMINGAAQRHGVDARLLTAIAIHETGNGTSDIVKGKNNPGGLYDSKRGEYMSFSTLEAGFEAMAKNLKENYIDQGLTSVEAIGNKWAKPGENDPKGLNKDWVPGVKAQLRRLGGGYSADVGGGTANVAGVNPALISRFAAVERDFGQHLDIISGYRSVAHNRAVGGASGSLHTHGNAIDVATGHLSHAQRLQLIESAVAHGITGIGVYANNLHFDLGRRRAWGPSHSSDSIPSWARPTLNRLGIA